MGAQPGLPYLVNDPGIDSGSTVDARQRAIQRVVRQVARELPRPDGDVAIEQIMRQRRGGPDDEFLPVLSQAYEAAVRATGSAQLAVRGLLLLLSRPELLAMDEREASRALLFATACGRLDVLADLALPSERTQAQFALALMAAKVDVVRNDLAQAEREAERALALAGSEDEARRAEQLQRNVRDLVDEDGAGISPWRLRALQHLLPRIVAEALETPWSSPVAAGADMAPADRWLRTAAAIDEHPSGALVRTREALASWASDMALGLLATEDGGRDGAALAFTTAAWRLLAPDVPGVLVALHARAVARACATLAEADLVRLALRPILDELLPGSGRAERLEEAVLEAWREERRSPAPNAAAAPPNPARLLGPVARCPIEPSTVPDLGGLAGASEEVKQVLERCRVDLALLLPSSAPFRGLRWFESETTRSLYQRGREEGDPRRAHEAFEAAWLREPGNHVAVQGLIHGLRARIGQSPSRVHVLQRVAQVLDQSVEREVEAALAYTALADLSASEPEQRSYRRDAIAALRRRTRRRPWTRARAAEIAMHVELGAMVAAGDAAWAESCMHRPGSPPARRFALLATALWEAEHVDRPPQDRVRAARERAAGGELTNEEAVAHAVSTGRLEVLEGLSLDEELLEELWRLCRGNEARLARFLEKEGTRPVDPRPRYVAFAAAKLDAVDPAAAARVRRRLATPEASQEPPSAPRLRLAAAELFTRDPLHEVARPRGRLDDIHLREFLAALRECVPDDAAAVTTFCAAVDDAVSALFDLRESLTGSPLEAGGLARASESIESVRLAARSFTVPAVVDMARRLWRYLGHALDAPIVEAYQRESRNRLVASSLGNRLGAWWAQFSRAAGPLDFFHFHQAYRCPPDASPEQWWRRHRVHNKPVSEAVAELLGYLRTSARALEAIEDSYLAQVHSEAAQAGFGLQPELDSCCRVLESALAASAGPDEIRAIEGALERLGTVLRGIDAARATDLDGVLHDVSVPTGCYLVPRVSELFAHWRRNAGSDPCLRAVIEIEDDADQDVLCLLCLDAGVGPVPRSTPLRGLSPLADLVDALGGRLHLWVARPGEGMRCRREHGDGVTCSVDEQVARIEGSLRAAATRWHVHRTAVEPWLLALDAALNGTGSATLAFAVVPRMARDGP